MAGHVRLRLQVQLWLQLQLDSTFKSMPEDRRLLSSHAALT